MTYEQLKVLQAIVQEGTFRGAATRVHKSQPAVSSLIKNLEDELGLPLFDRAGYRPKLTSEGQGFYEQAVIALREMSRLTALSQRLTGKEEREIRRATALHGVPRAQHRTPGSREVARAQDERVGRLPRRRAAPRVDRGGRLPDRRPALDPARAP